MCVSPPAFDLPEEFSHRRIDAESREDVWVIGDVHGCATELERLLDRIDPSPDDLLVFVGDLVRKGPDGHRVLELVRERSNAVSVLGNNEAKILRGDATDPTLDADDRAYLETLPLAVSFGDDVVVHGGIDPRRPLGEHTPEHLLTTRSMTSSGGYDGPFWFEPYDGPHRVFFGHTVVDAVLECGHAVGLDTGCVYGGALSAYRTNTGDVVSVPSTQEEWVRDDDQMVSARDVACRPTPAPPDTDD